MSEIKEKHKFKVTINNAGEILTFYTTTTSIDNAKRNAIYQLAKKLGRYPQGMMTQLRDRATVALASDDFIYDPKRHGILTFVRPRSLEIAKEMMR
jgi:hypothetical protein